MTIRLSPNLVAAIFRGVPIELRWHREARNNITSFIVEDEDNVESINIVLMPQENVVTTITVEESNAKS